MLKKVVYIFFSALIGILAGSLLIESIKTGSNSDFHVYYYIPKAVLTLARPTHPYVSYSPLYPYFFPPASIPLFYPLLLIPFYVAKILWTLLNFTLLTGSVYLVNKILFKRVGLFFYATLLAALLFYPIRFTINTGQFNIVLMFIFVASLFTFLNKKDSTMGILLTIGTITKITPSALVVYSLFRKRVKPVIWFMAFALAFVILAEIFVKKGINYYYARHVIDDVARQAESSISYREQSLLALYRRIFLFQNPTLVTIKNFKIDLDKARVLLAYATTFIELFIWLIFFIKRKKDKLNTILDFQILTIVSVVGTGLTWFHQYSMIFPSLIILMGLAFYAKDKKYKMIIFGITIFSYLVMAFNLYERIDKYILQLNLLYSTFVILFLYYFLKYKPSILSLKKSNFINQLTTTKKENLLAIIVIITLAMVTINPLTVNQTLKQDRDITRIKHINYMGTTIAKSKIGLDKGKANSVSKTERLDEGYIMIKKGQMQKIQKNLAILLLDPINNKKYNYKFVSTDGRNFTLTATLESKKYKDILGTSTYLVKCSTKTGVCDINKKVSTYTMN